MSSVARPPVQTPRFGSPDDDLDRLLRAFYRAELPDPMPSPQLPTLPAPRKRPPAARRRPRLGSRFALAATVIICLIGLFALSGVFTAPTAPEANLPPEFGKLPGRVGGKGPLAVP